MEEVDTIILKQLKAIGCDIDQDKISLKDFNMTEMMLCVIICLKNIPRLSISENKITISESKITPGMNMATKYNIAVELCDLCKKLGYHKSDLGYQTFLYGSHFDFRNLFLFLLEQLPKDIDQDQDKDSSLSYHDLLKSRIKFAAQNCDSWLPLMYPIEDEMYLKRDKHLSRNDIGGIINSNQLSRLRSLSRSKSDIEDIPTVVSVMKSSFSLSSSLKNLSRDQDKDETTKIRDDGDKVQDEEMKDQDKIDHIEITLKEKIQELENKKSNLKSRLQKIPYLENQLKEQNLELLEFKSMNLSIDDLDQTVDKIKSEIRSLNDKWWEIENELKEEKEQLLKSRSRSESEIMRLKINKIKDQITDNNQEMKDREIMISRLQSMLEKEGKRSESRKSYTRRILEIITNYQKQLSQITKITNEVRDNQKEINILSSKVMRSFAICDELIFSSINNSNHTLSNMKYDPEFYKSCYKLLANVHDTSESILGLVEILGSIKRSILKLEQQIEREQRDKIDEKLDKITIDLQNIKSANQQLAANLKTQS